MEGAGFVWEMVSERKDITLTIPRPSAHICQRALPARAETSQWSRRACRNGPNTKGCDTRGAWGEDSRRQRWCVWGEGGKEEGVRVVLPSKSSPTRDLECWF